MKKDCSDIWNLIKTFIRKWNNESGRHEKWYQTNSTLHAYKIIKKGFAEVKIKIIEQLIELRSSKNPKKSLKEF